MIITIVIPSVEPITAPTIVGTSGVLGVMTPLNLLTAMTSKISRICVALAACVGMCVCVTSPYQIYMAIFTGSERVHARQGQVE